MQSAIEERAKADWADDTAEVQESVGEENRVLQATIQHYYGGEDVPINMTISTMPSKMDAPSIVFHNVMFHLECIFLAVFGRAD